MTVRVEAAGEGRRRVLRIVTVAVAYLLQLVLLQFTVASGLLAPLWAVLMLYGVWLAATVLLVRTARSRPFAAPLVPLANVTVLWLVMTVGERALGWTA